MAAELLSPRDAAQILQDGGVIAAPTESVYGLSCDPDDSAAINRILALKLRPPGAGLILLCHEFEAARRWLAPVSDELLARANERWPGPVTFLFPRGEHTPDLLAGRHPTVAVRVTDHGPSRALCKAFGGAIVSTSANPHGQPPAKSVEDVQNYFGDRIDGILEGEGGGRDQPSEIVHLESGRVIRGA